MRTLCVRLQLFFSYSNRANRIIYSLALLHTSLLLFSHYLTRASERIFQNWLTHTHKSQNLPPHDLIIRRRGGARQRARGRARRRARKHASGANWVIWSAVEYSFQLILDCKRQQHPKLQRLSLFRCFLCRAISLSRVVRFVVLQVITNNISRQSPLNLTEAKMI